MSSNNTRLWAVRAGVVVGVFGLSIIAFNARGLGPAGKATGGAAGCNAGEADLAAARDLVDNPDVVDIDREIDPSVFADLGPYTAVDGRFIIELADPELPLDDPELTAALADLEANPPTPFVDTLPPGVSGKGFEGILVIQSPLPVAEVTARLNEVPAVGWSEPVTRLEPMTVGEGRPLQWNLDVIDRPWLTENTNGGAGATIAILDSGLQPGTNLVREGGWDFVDGDDSPDDGLGHGTLVASTIGMPCEAFCGVAPEATLVPHKVVDDSGFGNTLHLAAAVVAAAQGDSDVILMPIGGYAPSLLVSKALDFADASGSALVAAAGNQGSAEPAFPGRHPAVVSVGAVNPHLEQAVYSNGADVLAPGGDLTADLDGDGVTDGIIGCTDTGCQTGEGTSLAAAQVAAVVGIAMAEGDPRPDRIRELLTQDRDDPVFDAPWFVESTRAVARPGTASDAPVSAVRFPHADFRVELTWETHLPGDTVCETDSQTIVHDGKVTLHRVVLDLDPTQETVVHCTSTGDEGLVKATDIRLIPPTLAAQGHDCEDLSGGIVTAVKVGGEMTGSTGAVCTEGA